MNRIILSPEDFIDSNLIELTDRRLVHLNEVIKGMPGKVCASGILNGATGTAEILSINEKSATLQFEPSGFPPEKNPLTLVIALPRPQTLKKVIHAAVTQGARKIIFIGTFKVEKSYWSSPFLAPDFLLKEQLAALEQCGDTRLVDLEFHRYFKPFVEDVLPALANNSRLLAAHPAAKQPCPFSVEGETTLILGPEGGFTDFETSCLEQNGAELVSLGPRILRTEVALSALIGRLF